jgi:hypothetical protein
VTGLKGGSGNVRVFEWSLMEYNGMDSMVVSKSNFLAAFLDYLHLL